MLKVVAKRYLKAGVWEEYRNLAKELVDMTRTEQGCVDYGLYYDAEKNLAVMMETWESQEDLDRHLAHIISQHWPDKLNAYADPESKGGMEKFEQAY